jgi:hypothetical protein
VQVVNTLGHRLAVLHVVRMVGAARQAGDGYMGRWSASLSREFQTPQPQLGVGIPPVALGGTRPTPPKGVGDCRVGYGGGGTHTVPAMGTTPLSTLMPTTMPLDRSRSANGVPSAVLWYSVSSYMITPLIHSSRPAAQRNVAAEVSVHNKQAPCCSFQHAPSAKCPPFPHQALKHTHVAICKA